jgi:hypothetical protein
MHWFAASLTLGLCLGLSSPILAQSAAQTAVAVVPALGQNPLSPPAAVDKEQARDERCAFGELCFGPLVTLGAIDPIGVGAHLRYGRYLGFGVDYQFLPTHIAIGITSSTWSLFTVEGRVYPFGNAIFFSGGFGYQSFSGTAHEMTPAGQVRLAGSLGVPTIKLGVGLLGESGFVLGADIGFNILLGNPHVKFEDPTGPGASYQFGAAGLHQEINQRARQAMDSIPIVPQVNLIRMGYLF